MGLRCGPAWGQPGFLKLDPLQHHRGPSPALGACCNLPEHHHTSRLLCTTLQSSGLGRRQVASCLWAGPHEKGTMSGASQHHRLTALRFLDCQRYLCQLGWAVCTKTATMARWGSTNHRAAAPFHIKWQGGINKRN